MPFLSPQQALEQAVVNALRAATTATPPGLGYTSANCARTFDGRPPPSCGVLFVAVWSGGRRTQGRAGRTALDQVLALAVTITARFNQPFDREVSRRDDVEVATNAIVALIHQDSWGMTIVSAANTLAGYRVAGGPAGTSPVGFCEGLAWESTEDCREQGADWFMSKGNERRAAVVQTVHFGKARHVQAIPTAQ